MGAQALSVDQADELFEAGLIYNFKKNYDKAISYLEKAYRTYAEMRQTSPAARVPSRAGSPASSNRFSRA